jgi:IS30 family transposase
MPRQGPLAYDEQPRGERTGTSKLTAGDVEWIRQKAQDGMDRKEMAELCGVHVTTINRVIRRENWRHLP